MNLTKARFMLAQVLAPVADDDPTVLTSLVDAIEPPALMIGWGEPWLATQQTFCLYEALLVVTCVAQRLSPGDGVGVLESLVDYVRTRTMADTDSWPLDNVSGPRVFLIAKTNYLACRMTFKVAIDG